MSGAAGCARRFFVPCGEVICGGCFSREAEAEPDSDLAYEHEHRHDAFEVFPAMGEVLCCAWCGKASDGAKVSR